MPLSAIDIYKNLLPKTNCAECGHQSCLAFATVVVVEKYPLDKCPHIEPSLLKKTMEELKIQQESGRGIKRDLEKDALEWAKERSSSMEIKDLPPRIGGMLIQDGNEISLKLPYFNSSILIRKNKITGMDGKEPGRWEQVFIYNHMAMGGASNPSGTWRAFEEIPNTVSKIKSMIDHVEMPIINRFRGNTRQLKEAAISIGGTENTGSEITADLAMTFSPLPKIPVMLLFWDEEPLEGFSARAKLLFDKTITDHLDIESIMFLSERLRQLLCDY